MVKKNIFNAIIKVVGILCVADTYKLAIEKSKGVIYVKKTLEDRVIGLAEYIVDSKTTVRGAAKKFGVSKSTVHKDVSERLKYINKPLYMEVKKILEINKSERHIRGGVATKKKYAAAKIFR